MDRLVSIIIPTYNQGHLISRCIDSLVEQTHRNWEAIIVNNFSDDDTEKVVSGYDDPRIKLTNFKNDGIIAASRNNGIRQASGDYIAFLDSDDWWDKTKLELSIDQLDKADLVYHDLEVFVEGIKDSSGLRKGRELGENPLHNMIVNGSCIANSSVVMTKSIQDRVGFLSEDRSIVTVEDFDFWLRAAKAGCRFKYLNSPLGCYWVHKGSSTLAPLKTVKRLENLLTIHAADLPRPVVRHARANLQFRLIKEKCKINEKTKIQMWLSTMRWLPKLEHKIQCLILLTITKISPELASKVLK
jgi:glycosyltransferase involved in cell wall biosynthesis